VGEEAFWKSCCQDYIIRKQEAASWQLLFDKDKASIGLHDAGDSRAEWFKLAVVA